MGLKNYQNTAFPVVGYGPWILTGYQPGQYRDPRGQQGLLRGQAEVRPADHAVLQEPRRRRRRAAQRADRRRSTLLTATEYMALRQRQEHPGVSSRSPSTGTAWKSTPARRRAAASRWVPATRSSPTRRCVWRSPRVDRQTLVKKILDGLGTAGHRIYPSGLHAVGSGSRRRTRPSATTRPRRTSFSTPRATPRARTESGPIPRRTSRWPSGWYPLRRRQRRRRWPRTSSEWLKAIGIRPHVQSMSFNRLNANLAKGNWDMLMDGWSTGPDPTYLLSIQTCSDLPKDDGTGGNTDAFFCDPDLRQPVRAAGRAVRPDQAGRNHRPDAGDPVQGQRRHHALLRRHPQRRAHRQGDRTSPYGKPDAKAPIRSRTCFINWRTPPRVGGGSVVSSSTRLWIVLDRGRQSCSPPRGFLLWRRAHAAERSNAWSHPPVPPS